MYVCMCNGVTESAVRRAVQAGIRTIGELTAATGCGAGCGCCLDAAEELLLEASAPLTDRVLRNNGVGLAA